MSTVDDRVLASATAQVPANSTGTAEIATRGFAFAADDPTNDSPGIGPTPTEYLLMALASCTAMTLRSYADRKYDYAGDLTVRVDYHEPREEGAPRFLQRTISMTEQVPPDDLEVMMDIAERTPVTLLLQFAWTIRTAFTVR